MPAHLRGQFPVLRWSTCTKHHKTLQDWIVGDELHLQLPVPCKFSNVPHNHISVEGCIWMPNHLSGNAVAWTDVIEFDNNRLQGAVAHTASSQQTSNVCRLLLQGLQKWFLFQSCVTFERLTTATKEPSYWLKWFNLHAIEWKLFWHVLALFQVHG